jgi:hypothetical protein
MRNGTRTLPKPEYVQIKCQNAFTEVPVMTLKQGLVSNTVSCFIFTSWTIKEHKGTLKVHKHDNFLGFDFEISTFS